MDYTRLVAFMNKFNNDAYKLVDVENQQTSTSDAAGTATEHYRNLINPAGYSHVYGKLYPYDPGVGGVAPYRYKSSDVYKEVGFYLINVRDFADPDGHTYEGFIGPMCTKDVANGRERIFAVKGGGKDDTPANVEMQFVCEAMLVEDIFKPIQKALGIELLDDVSQEAKDWVRVYQNVANMHNGEVITHQPFDYPDFENVADNIYVRMCINDSNVVEDFFKSTTNAAIIGRNEDGEPITNGCWVNCYIDPYEGKTYFPYDLVQLFSNIINDCGGFNTDNTVASNAAINAGTNMSVPMRSLNQNDAPILNNRRLNNDEVVAAVNSNGLSSIMYSSFNSSSSGGVHTYIFSFVTVDNDFTITKGTDGSNYKYADIKPANESFKTVYVTAENDARLGNKLEVKNVQVVTTSSPIGKPSDNTFRIRWNRSTGEFVDYKRRKGSSSWSGSGTCFIGYKMTSNLIGTKPSTPSNIEHSYPAWYDAKADLESLRVVSLGEGYYNAETLTEPLLPMSIGEDAGAGKTQTDVHSGNTRAEDLDGGTSDGSNKSIIEDEGVLPL